MLKAVRKALSSTKNISRSAYIWNAVNSMVSALESPIILMVMTRTNGMYDAGVFSIAFAIAGLMLYIGLYGLRRFQSSDIKERYTFSEYHGMRILSCTVMIIACIIYGGYGLLFGDYDLEKFIVVIMICMARVIQAYSDVFHGRMQQMGRLDVAAKSSLIRYAFEIVAYCVALVITHNMVISTVSFVIVSFIVMLITSINASVDFCDFKPRFDLYKIKGLMIEGFPLFISLFLNMYISNAPKYAIDAYLSEQVQAAYNMIFMPAFMVMLVSNFIFNPILTTYAKLWHEKTAEKFKELLRNIRRQMFIITGLTIAGLLVAATFGIPTLSLIFGADLSLYKKELFVVMIGGGALAYATFFSTIITIVREQKYLLISYGVIAIIAKFASGRLVNSFGIMGAAEMYAVLMIILALMLAFVVVKRLKREWRILHD